MVPRDGRRMPTSLPAALLLLGLVALLGTLLLGLLAQPATAEHGAPAGPALVGPASPDDSATPEWTFTRPADSTVTEPAVYDGSDTRTVTITHTYDTQCVYGSAPAGDADFAGAAGGCGVVVSAPTYRYTGAVTADGSYVLSARTAETTTTSTETVAADGSTSTVTTGPTTRYSAIESAAYVHDTTAPALAVTGPATAVYTGWTVDVSDASPVTRDCTLAGPGASLTSFTCNSDTVSPALTTDGDYTLTVLATDAVGSSTTVTSDPFRYDGTNPVVTFTAAPTGPSRTTTVTWTWTADEPGTTTCSLTGPGGTSAVTCSGGSYTTTLTQSGQYSLTVTVTDAAGNPGTATSAAYELDVTAPTLTITPGSTTDSADSVTWTVDVDTAATLTCSLSTGENPACTDAGTVTATLAADGSVSLTVTAADAAGNTATRTVTYIRDTTVVLTVSGPSGPSADRTPTWTFTGEPVTVVSCTLEADGNPVAGPAGSSCTSTGFTAGELPPTAGTSYVLVVTVEDAVGNPAVVRSAPYVLDTSAATLTLDPAPGQGGVDNSTSPSWTFTGDTWTGPTCVLTVTGDTTALGGSCTETGFTSPVLTGPSGTEYTLTVTATDSAGNTSTGTATYLLDTTAPGVAVDPVTSPSNDRTPTFSGTFEPGAASASCTLVDSGGAPVAGTCTVDLTAGTASFSPTSALPVTSGETYVFTLSVVDAAGNAGSAELSYALDTVADLGAVTEPSSPGNDTTPAWTWTSEPGSTVTCVLTGPGAAGGSCGAGGFTASPLPGTSGADYVLTVTVVDLLGNRTAVTYDYALDTVTDFAAVDAPVSPGNDTSPTWTWTAEGSSTVTCVLTDDAGAVVFDGACSTGGSFTSADLPDTSGTSYTLTVTVVDAVGNSTTTTLPTYLLDTLSDVTPAIAPASPGNDTTPTWTWTVEPGATAACVLVDGTGAVVFDDVCTSATSFTAAALASTAGTTYTLTITVTDVLGNATTTTLPPYLLDTVLELDVTGPTGPSPVRAPVWTFAAEPLTTLVCTLTGPDGVDISGGICDENGYRAPPLVNDGDHVLTVRGVDAAGNDVTQTFGYDLDTLHLTVAGPTGPSPDRTPTWTFTDERYVTADCVLTGPDGVVFAGPCTTTSSFTADQLPLTPGADYVLTVTVVDSIGNGGTATTSPYRLDTQLPVATITVPGSPSREVDVTWTVAADEPVLSASCELRRDGVVVLSLTSCPGSTTVTLPGDGRYDLVVTLVDLAGNPSTTTSTVLVHDAAVPVAPQVSPSSTTTNRTTATWTISADGGTSVTTCRVLRDGAVVADWAPCDATFTLPLGADGSYVLEVVSTDPAGPGPTTRATYLLDTLAPAAPSLTGPTGPSPSRSPSWSVGTEAGTSVDCRLLRAGAVALDWAPCSGTFAADLTGLPDGDYVLEARATDLAGNVSTVAIAATYVLDSTAPLATVVTGPTGPSQLRSPVFSWTGEAGAGSECQLSRDGAVVGGWVTCTSGYAPVLDRDGTWTLAVRLTDAAGNVSDPASSGGYVLDTTAPPAPVVTPPQTPGRDLEPSWGVIIETGAGMDCRLTGPDGLPTAWDGCTLPHVTTLTGRPDGAYVLEVRATDVAGNTSPVGSGTYVLDTVAPAAAVVTVPASPGRTRTPTFAFTVEPGSSTRCRLTSGSTLISDFVACSGTFTVDLTGLADGTYTVTVRVSDAAGNPGPAATGTYVLDTTGPAAPVLVLSPASPSPTRSATWAFSYEPGATLVCRLAFPTGAVREIPGCTSPLTIDLSGLPDGTYTLTVRAVDAAGNVGGTLTDIHVIDSAALAPPTVTGPVTPGSTRTPRWTFSSATATECRLTRGTTVLADWTACTSQYVAALFNQPDGTYALSVRSTSNGQVSAASTSRYVLDTTAPSAATVVAPPTPSTNRRPTWTIASPELGAGAECRVLYFGAVLRDWSPCAVTPEGAPFSALDLTSASDGTYTLVVRLTDAAGNRGAETSSAYVLDTSAPVGVGVTGPPSPGNDLTPTWTFTTAGALVLECRLTSDAGVISDWDTCAGSFTADLTDQPDGVYFLFVRAVSEAGTPGPETSVPYTLSTALPDGPTALVLSGTKPVDNDRSPTWTFTLPSGTTAHCSVMSGSREIHPKAPCTSPFTLDLSTAADGSYTLTVWAVDGAGSESEPVSSTYRLDVSAPSAPTFTQEPGATGSTLTPQWRFTTVHSSTPECRVRFGRTLLGDWAPCTALYVLDLTLRPDGEYVLEVRAVDAAGNSSPPVSSTYLLDRTAAPIATFTATPVSPGRERSVAWAFTAPDGYSLECRLVSPDGATSWAPCGSTTGRYDLTLTDRRDGDYVLEVHVVDAAGNRGSASRATYALDTTPPAAPTFSDAPPDAGNDPRPTWSWDATSDDEVECRLLRNGVVVQGWAECTAPFQERLSSQGTYRLEIRRVDAAGNASDATGSDYVFDTTPPDRPVLFGPPSSGSDRTVSWTFAMPAGVTATCTVTRGLNRVDERPCNGGRYDLDLSGQPDGTYTLTVRFTDAAGNPGRPASGQYLLRTVGMPGRLVPAPSGPAPSAPGGPGRAGTGAGGVPPQGFTPDSGVPTIPADEDVPRDRAERPGTFMPGAAGEEAAAGDGPGETGETGSGAALVDPLPLDRVPEVLREAVTGTITRPTLPLALLAIVVLFLLAQNRIDRRDPKLASAPVEAEPELDFTFIARRPGGALP